MTYCRPCRKYFDDKPEEWKYYDGPFGYSVLAKLGKKTYRCVCLRCGHIWRSNSKNAEFQFNQPEVYRKQKDLVDQFYSKLVAERRQGYTLLIYPKTLNSR